MKLRLRCWSPIAMGRPEAHCGRAVGQHGASPAVFTPRPLLAVFDRWKKLIRLALRFVYGCWWPSLPGGEAMRYLLAHMVGNTRWLGGGAKRVKHQFV